MQYDKSVSELYRNMQRVIPGVDALYALVGAVMECEAPSRGHILIVGAGGGRELETLGPSAKAFSFTAVDPSPDMMELAARYAQTARCADRTRFLVGDISAAAIDESHDAATALLVMHFLPDDGAKLKFLTDIRARLKPGALLLHADVCFENDAAFARYLPWFRAHAVSAGLDSAYPHANAIIERGPETIRAMPIIGEERTRELFLEAGFDQMTPIYRGLWYALWAARAAA